MEITSNLLDFEGRTNFPSKASKSKLEKIGARHFIGQSFTEDKRTLRIEQMQYLSGGCAYLWKRIVDINNNDERLLFKIHMEITGSGIKYYK